MREIQTFVLLLFMAFPNPGFTGFARSRIGSCKMEGVNLAARNSSGTGMLRMKHLHVEIRAIQHAIKEIPADAFPGLQFQGNIASVPKSQFDDFEQLLLRGWTKLGSLEAVFRRIFKPILRHRHHDRETGSRLSGYVGEHHGPHGSGQPGPRAKRVCHG